MAGEPERILLDTNVLLSAVLFGGKPERLVEAARTGRIRAVTSLYILREFQDVLTSPRFGVDPGAAEELAVELASFMEVALRGGATVIVTGDQQLLQVDVPGLQQEVDVVAGVSLAANAGAAQAREAAQFSTLKPG